MRFIICILIFKACNLFSDVVMAESGSKALPTRVIWISGGLPGNYLIEGNWVWSNEVTRGGIGTHEEGITKGIESHLFRTDSIVRLSQDSKIIQYVNLDPENMPSGIMLKFFLNSDKEINIYWEGEDESFVALDEYITAWYMGFIPNPGRWIGLEINCAELDIEDDELAGMEFVVNNGRAWWGETIIINQYSSCLPEDQKPYEFNKETR